VAASELKNYLCLATTELCARFFRGTAELRAWFLRSNVTKKRREVLEKEDYINDIMHQFQNKMLTRLEFIEKLAYKNLPVGF